jgi:hypothetical protein
MLKFRVLAAFRPVGLVLLVVVTLYVTAGLAQDACSDVLNIGLRDTYNRAYSNSLVESLRDWASSEASKDFWQSHSDGLNLNVPDYLSLGISSTQNSGGTTHVKNEKEFTQSINSQNAEQLATVILSPIASDAIEAWKICTGERKRSSPNGVSATVESYSPDDNRFVLAIKWRNTFARQRDPLIDDYAIDNAVCPAALSKLGKSYFSRQAVSDVDLECTRTDKTKRVTFSMNTDQGPLMPRAVLPIYTPPPTGHCSASCDRCIVEHGAYVCKSCTIKVSSLLQPGVDHIDVPVRQPGMRFACYPLAEGSRYKLSAQGTIRANFTTNAFDNRTYGVGEKISNGKPILWWVQIGYKIDGDENFRPAFEDTAAQGPLNSHWSDKDLGAVTSVGGSIWAQQSQISPSVLGSVSLDKDFTVTITPE